MSFAATAGCSPVEVGIAAALLFALSPFALVVHELGHLLTARLCGLEVGGIGIGKGKKVWVGDVLGIPVRLLAWPMTGRVYLGGFRLSAMRARVGLATLMGPGANAIMVWVTINNWDVLVGSVGTALLMAWIYVNALMAASNLVPSQYIEGGVTHSSDGRTLIRLLRPNFDASPYGIVAPLMRGVTRLENRQYAQAERACELGLSREPDSLVLLWLIAACRHELHDPSGVLQRVDALLSRPSLPPYTRAHLQQLGVLARLVLHRGVAQDDPRSLELDRLSAESYAAFPCDLSIRSARALVCVARGDPSQALTLLDYIRYDAGTRAETGGQAAVRFCAYRILQRESEARHALALARRLHPESLGWVVRMGLAPPDVAATW